MRAGVIAAIVAFALTAFAGMPAAAQPAQLAEPTSFFVCVVDDKPTMVATYTDPFEFPTPNGAGQSESKLKEAAATILRKAGSAATNFYCHSAASAAAVDAVASANRARATRDDGWNWRLDSDLGPRLRDGAKLGLKRLTLVWRGHDGLREGYQSASIDLVYTFLNCMGEIHFAYSLDRKSFEVSRNYFVPAHDGQPALSTEVDPPSAPSAVRLLGTVKTNEYPPRALAAVDDAFAGEALGMGCFTGQTRKVGTVAQLVGAGATPDKVGAFLATLTFEPPMFLIEPLTRGGMAGAAARKEAERRLAAEAAAADAKKVDETNAGALDMARKAGKEIDDRMAAGRKAQADYDAAVERTKRETEAIAAENARRKAAFDARTATHAACVAGDQAACARYAAGQ